MDRAEYYVDASSNQEDAGPINLREYARAGHEWISLKATEGIGYTWDNGNTLHRLAHRLRLRVERYHVLYFANPARAQALACHRALSAGGFDVSRDRVMVDIEALGDQAGKVSDHQRAHVLTEFCEILAGLRPGVAFQLYLPDWYADGKPELVAAVKALGYPVTASDYDPVPAPRNTAGLNVTVWQITDRATVPGFLGPVDYNRILVPTPAPEAPLTPQDKKEIAAMIEKATNELHATIRSYQQKQNDRIAAVEHQIAAQHPTPAPATHAPSGHHKEHKP